MVEESNNDPGKGKFTDPSRFPEDVRSTVSMKQQFIYILTIVGVCCLILGVVICTIISGIMDKRESLEPSEGLEPTIELCGVATIGDSPPQPVRFAIQPGTPLVFRYEKPINMILKRCAETKDDK